MKFTKMHGCGNDYIYINGAQESVPAQEKPALARRLSDRHFGIGGDGVIFINPSDQADFEMEMYNADGTRAEMCGNGIRCVAKYVYDNGLTSKTEGLPIISAGRVRYLDLFLRNGRVDRVRVNMGSPELAASRIPVRSDRKRVINEEIAVDGRIWRMTCVSMGNPHAVVFVDDPEALDLPVIGPAFERHACFPNRTNVEFVSVLGRDRIRMRVWERGTGETLACGTGCCAAAVASVLNGLTDEKLSVRMPGGEIEIEWDRLRDQLYMTGPAVTVFEGETD